MNTGNNTEVHPVEHFAAGHVPGHKVCPARQPAIEEYKVADEVVLYDPLRERVYGLNASAYAVWQGCDGHMTVDAISRQLAGEAGLPFEKIASEVWQVIQHLHQLDLVFAEEVLSPAHREELLITFGRHYVRIHTDLPEIVEGIQSRFSQMLVDDSAAAVNNEEAGVFGVYKVDSGYTVSGTRAMHVKGGGLAEAFRALKHELLLKFIEARPDLIWLHAGAVTTNSARDGAQTWMFAGDWGAGKSTFVTSLYKQGWQYLSDDIVPLNPETGRILAFPFTPAAREQRTEVLEREEVVQLVKTPVELSTDTVCAIPVSVDALFFPVYEPGNPCKIVPCAPATAAVKLIEQCQNMVHHREGGVEMLCSLIEKVPAYHVYYSDAESAIMALIESPMAGI